MAEEQNYADPTSAKIIFFLMGLPRGTHGGWDVIVPGTARKDKQTQYAAPEA